MRRHRQPVVRQSGPDVRQPAKTPRVHWREREARRRRASPMRRRPRRRPAAASGRRGARQSGRRWGPRTPCGSRCEPSSSRCRSSSPGATGAAPCGRRRGGAGHGGVTPEVPGGDGGDGRSSVSTPWVEGGQPGDGHPGSGGARVRERRPGTERVQPVGPVAGLVDHLVHGLVEARGAQQREVGARVERRRRRRSRRRTATGCGRPTPGRAAAGARRRRARCSAPLGAGTRVVERAEHARPRRAGASPGRALSPAAGTARPRSRARASRAAVRSSWPRCRSPCTRWTHRPGRCGGGRSSTAWPIASRARGELGPAPRRPGRAGRVHLLGRLRAVPSAASTAVPKASASSACTAAIAAPSRWPRRRSRRRPRRRRRSPSASHGRTGRARWSGPASSRRSRCDSVSCSIAMAREVVAPSGSSRLDRAVAAGRRPASRCRSSAAGALEVGVEARGGAAEHLEDRPARRRPRLVLRLLRGQQRPSGLDVRVSAPGSALKVSGPTVVVGDDRTAAGSGSARGRAGRRRRSARPPACRSRRARAVVQVGPQPDEDLVLVALAPCETRTSRCRRAGSPATTSVQRQPPGRGASGPCPRTTAAPAARPRAHPRVSSLDITSAALKGLPETPGNRASRDHSGAAFGWHRRLPGRSVMGAPPVGPARSSAGLPA